MVSRIFVDRPILSTVISLFIILAGIMAIINLPVEQYPDMIPPTVKVSTTYYGAPADVIADTVAAPLEQKINGVEDMLYMTSTSAANGALDISITFAVGTDPDQAVINVNNRVQTAMPTLPSEVSRNGITVDKRTNSILMILSLTSPDGRYSVVELSNYALVNIIDDLKRVPGVGDASIFGAKDYAIRVWLKPDKLAQLKLTPSDVISAIQEQNSQFATGRIGQMPTSPGTEMSYAIKTLGRLSTPEEFEEIILRGDKDGEILRLRDVATVELGAKDYEFFGTQNGLPSVPMGIYLSPGANALGTRDRIMEKVAEISETFPAGMSISAPYDTTTFVRISIKEVIQTLIEAMFLVFFVIYIFLQDWRATIIPCVAAPISIIGTFAGMYVLGFSINTLTLFGLVLAIGTVVDDAIVVMENVDRIMTTENLSPRDATIKAMNEVTGPIIAILLTQCSIFVPVSFMGGLTGAIYKQFAITLTVSVFISAIVALTLTPALCRLLLRREKPRKFKAFVLFDRGLESVTNKFSMAVRIFLRRSLLTVVLFILFCAATGGMMKWLPSSLVPDEDQGYILTVAYLPDGAALPRTMGVMERLEAQLSGEKDVIKDVMAFSGMDLLTGGMKSSAGVFFMTLQDWDARTKEDQSSFALVNKVLGIGMGIPEALIMAFNPPGISGMSNTGGFEGYVQNRAGTDSATLYSVVTDFVAKLNDREKYPELSGVTTTFRANVPEIYVDLNREKARSLGVPVNAVFEAMQATFGTYYVNDFTMLGRTFRVMLQSEAQYRSLPDTFKTVFVRSDKGEMIPLTSLLSIREQTGTDVVERFNVFPAAKIVGGPSAGHSSGQALDVMERAARDLLPEGYTLAWTGSAYQEKLTASASTQIFLLGLLMVFLILAAQYEKWASPIAVLTAVPFAMFGAFLAVLVRGMSNDVYLQISLVTLIGLAAKNAILIVEFAMIRRQEGASLDDAAAEAAHLRFRPIMMTSWTFVLGCIPLVLSSGAGAASRHSIGTGVIGGMIAATIFAPLFIPSFFKIILSASEWLQRKRGKGTLPPPQS